MATYTVTVATVSQIHTAGIGACNGGSSSCPLNRKRRCITRTFSTTLCQTCCLTSIMGCLITCWHGTMWYPARRNSLELSVGGLKEVYPKSKCYCIDTRIMAANYATMLWITVANLVHLHNFLAA